MHALAPSEGALKTEVIAGITTFLAAMYIIVVNPSILQDAGLPFSAVLTATVLVSSFSSIAMGLYARNPILLAPGMGLNAFFAYGVVLGMNVPWQTALGAVFWSGVIFFILSVFNIRTAILKAIPAQVRYGVAGGIGLFITFIGFKNAGFIVANKATLLGQAPLDPVTLTFLGGLAVTSALVAKRVKGALILGIVFTTLAAIPIGRLWGATETGIPLVNYTGVFAAPDFSLLFSLDFIGSVQFAVWPVIFAFLFTDMFDSLSTFMGVAEAAGLVDDKGEPRNIKQSMLVDAASTLLAGVFGSSAGTSYIESATGIEEGGRGGLTAAVAGICFLPFMFFSPLLSVVPSIATAPALVLVGVFMMAPVMKINWGAFDDSIPAFLALILIPLSSSITQGILWAFLAWTVIKCSVGKCKEVSPMLVVIDLFAILSLLV